MIKAIVSDIDGTLTAIDPYALPTDKVTAAVKKVTQKGIHFSLASGRPFFLVEYLIKHLSLTSPVITDNGAVISNIKGEILWEAVLDRKEAGQIIALTKKYKATRLSCDIANIKNPVSIPANAKVRKVSIHDLPPDEADNLIKKLEKEFKDLAIIRAASYKGQKYTDIYVSNAEATKQHAILKYAELLGISIKEIMGVGDGYNDFPLLMACGIKVAMGNAVPDIKSIADYIAPSVENDGMVNILEKYILNP